MSGGSWADCIGKKVKSKKSRGMISRDFYAAAFSQFQLTFHPSHFTDVRFVFLTVDDDFFMMGP
jgi:hypothetical protein